MLCANCFVDMKNQKGVACAFCGKVMHRKCSNKKDDQYCCDTCKLEKPKETRKQFEMPKLVRRSHIETYKSCPFKFYMEVVKGIEQGDTIYTQLGTDMHELFEKGVLNVDYHKEKMSNDFIDLFKKYDAEMFSDKAQYEKMFQRGLSCIDNFYKTLPTVAKTVATEEKIITPIATDLPDLSVTIDHIGETPDGKELILSDWKTGAVMVGTKFSSDLQAPLYIYSAREKYNKPIKRFIFYYLDSNKQRVFERLNHDTYVCCVNKREYQINITNAVKDVQRVFSRIKAGEFNVPKDMKGMYFNCKMCHIKEKGGCQGVDVESWKQYNKN